MPRMTRRSFLNTTISGGAAAVFSILTQRAEAAEFNWRYANELVPTHPMNVHLQRAVELIREQSGGRMQSRPFS